jgi:hypothetical protein
MGVAGRTENAEAAAESPFPVLIADLVWAFLLLWRLFSCLPVRRQAHLGSICERSCLDLGAARLRLSRIRGGGHFLVALLVLASSMATFSCLRISIGFLSYST